MPLSWISGWATPSLSTRLRMMSIARFSEAAFTFDCAVGLPSYTSCTPPFRSRPRRVFLNAIAAAEPAIRPATSNRMRKLRRRSAIALARLLLRRQHEQQPAVVVVIGEHVGQGARGDVTCSTHPHRHLQRAHTPLEHLADGIIAVGKLEPEHLRHRPADHVFLLEARERERVLPAAGHATLAVAHEEGGVGRRIVVVEQFKQKREPAPFAALALSREGDVAVQLARAVATVGADEGVGHDRLQTTRPSASTLRSARSRPRHPMHASAGGLRTAPPPPAWGARARDARRRRRSPRVLAACA